MAEPELIDELTVSPQIGPLHIVQEPAAPANHLQQTTAAVIVLLVGPEVLRQIVDPLGEKRYLNLRGARVPLVRPVLFNYP
jgi:hypothetical protein